MRVIVRMAWCVVRVGRLVAAGVPRPRWRRTAWYLRGIVAIAGAVLLVSLAFPPTAFAHDGLPPAPHDLWRAWYWQPTVLLGLSLATWTYARGTANLRARSGRNTGLGRWRAIAWVGGLLTLFIALVSPLHALGEALFSAHMAQHLLLAVVAPPLLVLGAPLVPLLWALPMRHRRRLHNPRWRFLARVAHAARRCLLPFWLLHVAALWAWHAPALYELALRSEIAHATEHATLLGTGILFWWAALPPNLRAPARGGAGVPALFALAVQGGALGGLLLASGTPWYPVHGPWTAAWGLTPLADQQLAGLLMMLPGDAIYLAAALTIIAAWLRPADSRSRPARAQPVATADRAGPPSQRPAPATKGGEP